MRANSSYNQLMGPSIDEAQKRFWHQNYTVRATASFTRHRVGHPKMPIYKRWAMQIIDGLQREFDEQVIWRETRDNFVLDSLLAGTKASQQDRSAPPRNP